MKTKSAMNYIQRTAIAAYVNYMNNFITLEAFAREYGVPLELASKLVESGRVLREDELHFFGRSCGEDNFKNYLKGFLD